MTIEEVRAYFLGKKGAIEYYPFGPETPIFKVGNKMFALISDHFDEPSINLKYNKDGIEMLRAGSEWIIPGYHMNKSHWNTLFTEKLDDSVIKDLIDVSYNLVYGSLTKAAKKAVEE